MKFHKNTKVQSMMNIYYHLILKKTGKLKDLVFIFFLCNYKQNKSTFQTSRDSFYNLLNQILLCFTPKIFICVTIQFSSVAQSCLILCDPMDCSTTGLPVHHQLLEPTQTHVHQVSDAIQPSYPLSSPFPPAFNLSQHQGLFQGVSSLHQVATVLEFQLQPQSFQWIFKVDFL